MAEGEDVYTSNDTVVEDNPSGVWPTMGTVYPTYESMFNDYEEHVKTMEFIKNMSFRC